MDRVLLRGQRNHLVKRDSWGELDPLGQGCGMLAPAMSDITQRLSRVAKRKTVRLTHYGRKSGKPYRVTIWFLVEGDNVYLTTMNMARQWTQNVQQRPEVELEIGGERF